MGGYRGIVLVDATSCFLSRPVNAGCLVVAPLRRCLGAQNQGDCTDWMRTDSHAASHTTLLQRHLIRPHSTQQPLGRDCQARP
jgi:hypothetical protein